MTKQFCTFLSAQHKKRTLLPLHLLHPSLHPPDLPPLSSLEVCCWISIVGHSPAVFLFLISSLNPLWSESIIPVISIPLVVHMGCMAPNMASLSDFHGSLRRMSIPRCWMKCSADVVDAVDGWCWSVHMCSHGTSASLGLSMTDKRVLNSPAVGMDSSVPSSTIFSFGLMCSDTLMSMHAHYKLLCLFGELTPSSLK